MPIPIIAWGIGALVAGGYAANSSKDLADSFAGAAKYAAIAGGVYVSYRALQASGVLK